VVEYSGLTIGLLGRLRNGTGTVVSCRGQGWKWDGVRRYATSLVSSDHTATVRTVLSWRQASNLIIWKLLISREPDFRMVNLSRGNFQMGVFGVNQFDTLVRYRFREVAQLENLYHGLRIIKTENDCRNVGRSQVAMFATFCGLKLSPVPSALSSSSTQLLTPLVIITLAGLQLSFMLSYLPHCNYTVSSFYFGDYSVKCWPILIIFGNITAGKIFK